jgi:hypothetical protein
MSGNDENRNVAACGIEAARDLEIISRASIVRSPEHPWRDRISRYNEKASICICPDEIKYGLIRDGQIALEGMRSGMDVGNRRNASSKKHRDRSEQPTGMSSTQLLMQNMIIRPATPAQDRGMSAASRNQPAP